MERLNFNMRYLANLKGKRCIFYLPTHVSILLNLHYRYANLLHPINVPFLSPATTSIAANDSSVWQLTQKKTWAEGLGDLQCPDVNIHISYPSSSSQHVNQIHSNSNILAVWCISKYNISFANKFLILKLTRYVPFIFI